MPSMITTLTTAATLLAAALSPAAGSAAASLRATTATGSALSEAIQSLPEDLLEVIALGFEDLGDEHSGRNLLRWRVPRRRRGSSGASPKKKSKRKSYNKKKSSKKKSSKKKSSKKKSSKKKSSKKKSSPQKKSSSKKKSPPKKKSSKKKSPSPNFRQKFTSSIKAESRSSVTIGGLSSGGSYSVTSRTFTGHGTHFAAMGKPYAGCGVPPHKAYDDNGTPLPWIALNTNSEFENGINCARWVEIKLGDNCVGAGNSQWSICNGGSWQSDGRTGEIMYGYVMDHCPDNNYWCKLDPYHLDLSRPYLIGKGLTGPHIWNGRKIHWSYINDTPPGWKMSKLKFMWLKSSNWIPRGHGFFACLILYNLSNGISRVSQKVGSKWVSVQPLLHLRNQWVLEKPANYVSAPNGGAGQHFEVEVWDADGKSYGRYKVEWTCGTGSCWDDFDAPAVKL